jgi:peroxin-1
MSVVLLLTVFRVSTIAIKKNTIGSLILKRCISNTATTPTIKLGLESAQQKMQFENAVKEAAQAWLSKFSNEFVVSQGMCLSLKVEEKTEEFIVQLGAKKGLFGSSPNNETEQYIVVSPKQSIPIEFGEDVHKPLGNGETTEDLVIALGGVDKILQKIEQYTLANLSERDLKNTLSVPGSGGVLVTGAHGSGKTSVVKHILKSVKSARICK